MSGLPLAFIQTIRNTFGEDGQHWLESLPDLLDEASRRWNLTDIQPVSNLSYNFVAFAQNGGSTSERSRSTALPTCSSTTLRSAQKEVILKLGVPNRELTSEIAALQHYAGHGAAQLLDADAEKGVLLIERLRPGHMLARLEDDERATRIAADVMGQLWRPVPENTEKFIKLKDWFDGFERLRKRYDGKTGPLPEKMVAIAESLSKELLLENKEEMLLHGDFHHYNVLESARGWLAIDPKGVIGPRGYEVGPFLINPNGRSLSWSNPQACLACASSAPSWPGRDRTGTGERSRKIQTKKRIAILSEILGMERERICAWGICHAVLSAWWNIEDNELDWGDYSIHCAEIIMQA